MQIKLNNKVGIDLPKLVESRLLVQANSGGGKSWAIRRIVEQAFDHVQIIVLDPEGEFTNLRSEYGFIFCGKDGDAPAESRSATMLAQKLLELKASAIIDLYELPPQERKHFVKLFLESMVNAPKELWNDVLVILDEAHVFAPEKSESEALTAVIDMASRGRKRGFCLIPATQRPAKLNKDVAAECNNKLIGRASLDIDRKRAAEELGFTTRDQVTSLRDLEPGEFYAFGPAISREVILTKIGDVNVKPPRRGENRNIPPPPTDKVKKMLAKLADLPQEAQKQAQTVAELKTENATLKRQLATRPEPVKAVTTKIERIEVPMIGKKAISQFEKSEKSIRKSVAKIQEVHEGAQAVLKALDILAADLKKVQSSKALVLPPAKAYEVHARPPAIQEPVRSPLSDTQQGSTGLTGPEQKILDAIQWMYSIGVTEPEQTAVAFLAGYTFGGGGFNNPKGSLRTKGLIEYVAGNKIKLTYEGSQQAKQPDQTPTTQELHSKVLSVLDGPQQRILKPLLEAYPEPIENSALAEASGYSIGGGFNNPKGRLRSLGLIEYLPGNMIRARDILFV